MDLSNYATKSNFKNDTGVETSDLVKKADLDSSNSSTDQLVKVPSGVNSLRSTVDNFR